MALACRDDADVRDPEEQLLERLAMRRPVASPPPHRRSHDQRHGDLVVVHLPELRDAVHDLVETEGDEVAEHDLEDRAEPAQRHPGGDTEHPALADRGRQHPLGEAVAQTLRHLERTAVGIEHVLAEQVDVRARLENVVQCLIQDLHAALRLAVQACVPRLRAALPLPPRRSPRDGFRTPLRCARARPRRCARQRARAGRARDAARSRPDRGCRRPSSAG